MVNTNNGSRLEEINFSANNLRDSYITSQADYIAALRDEALFSNWGITVLVRVPAEDRDNLNINNVDEYSNFVDIHWIDTTETVIPKFDMYHEHVSDEGMQMDGTDGVYPLEIMVPTKLFLPKNSRIILSEYDAREQKIAREWVVLSTQVKQLSGSVSYTQIANCVPARKETYNNSHVTGLGTIYFDCSVSGVTVQKHISSQNTIWFIRDGIKDEFISKGYVNDIFEDTDDNPEINEHIEPPYYYPCEKDQIIEADEGFKENDVITFKDEEGNDILINIDGEEETKPLMLIVHEVDEKGKITDFFFGPNFGFTPAEEPIELTGTNLDGKEVKVIWKAIPRVDSDYQESLDPMIDLHPVYVKVKKVTAVFTSRKVAMSVLN